MQALAERLDTLLAGMRLDACEVLGFSGLKTVEPAPDSLTGRELERVGRRGKFLVLDFGGPRVLVHLSQAGRVDVEQPSKRTRGRGAIARLRFSGSPRRDGRDDGGTTDRALLLREHGTERKAGWWVLAPGDDGPLATLGPEPGSEELTHYLLGSDDPRRLHTILRDQRTVAGVGRGYADDVLHHARLSPFATLRSLPAGERERLDASLGAVLGDALERERRREGGLSDASLAGHFTVHGKAGLPCPVCGEDLARVAYESHEVVYCPRCQTGGRVLADRRLSRLVR